MYRARDKSTDTIVALKKMRFSLTEDGVPMAILREISLLKQLEKFDHPNIVRYVIFSSSLLFHGYSEYAVLRQYVQTINKRFYLYQFY